MEGLPYLPGNTFIDPTRSKYHRSQSLGYKNGYALPKRPEVGIGGVALPYNNLSEQELDELANYKPTLTYGQAKQAPPEDFVPGHLAWDKKVLKFNAWFKQTVHESPSEHYRVRHVNLYYYLEDDSIAVVEPPVENSGIPQGKLIKRQRLPKNDVGDHWHWKDLNLGINVAFYGKVFHLYNCDEWTRGYLESEGVDVAAPEGCPSDPYIETRKEVTALKTYDTPSEFDKLRQFMEMDRKVLRFFCVWDDRDNMFGEIRKFVIHYYLVDDTLEVREAHQANDGRDPFPILINRGKVPIDRYKVNSTFPGIVMELSDQEIKEYFTPKDFAIGQTVNLYNRRFLIYDVDNFTKAFYWKNFGMTDFTPLELDQRGAPVPKMEVPPYNNYGSTEDSLQSCISLIPEPPKKDFVKMMENDGKTLRFEAALDTRAPENKGRRFIISYRLADDMITIHEPPVKNSGIIGGKFLERTRVAKPGGSPEQPQFYGPQDMYIGAVIEVFRHRFIITNADYFVLKYMEEHSHQFPAHTIQSLREKLGSVEPQKPRPSSKGGPVSFSRTGDMREMIGEIKGQLRKIGITSSERMDKLFLGIDMERQGFITKNNIQQLCIKHNLPSDPDIVEAISREIGSDPEHISLDDFRKFLEL